MSLSCSVLLQQAFIEDCTASITWLQQPMTNFQSLFHSPGHSFILFFSAARSRRCHGSSPPSVCIPLWDADKCMRTCSYTTDLLVWFTLQSPDSVVMGSDSGLRGSSVTLAMRAHQTMTHGYACSIVFIYFYMRGQVKIVLLLVAVLW